MLQNSLAIAIAYFQHWLRKEDLYSQQSPFIFSLYQGLLAHLKSPQPFHPKDVDFSSSIFLNLVQERIKRTEDFNVVESLAYNRVWQPRKKAALLCSHFCQTTAAKQVMEIGTGTGAVTRLLDQVTKGNLYTFTELDSFDSEVPFSSRTTVISGFSLAKFTTVIQDLDALDFVVIHPQFPNVTILESLSICLPRMQPEGILVLGGIHQSKEMIACWQKVQKDSRTKLTLDFFDYGVIFFSYSGPKISPFLSF